MLKFFKNTNNKVIENYIKFYDKNKTLNLAFYGLIPYENKSPSCFYAKNYFETIDIDFMFSKECIWEDLDDEKEAEKEINKVQFGNITIAYEGCGIYWILVTSGLNAGEVWLLTEFGLRPISKSLEEWKEKILENPSFWYEKVKDWGPFEYSFFYSHAAKKMITSKEYVFGISNDLCRDCNEFMIKHSQKFNDSIVITSPKGTTVYKNGEVNYF